MVSVIDTARATVRDHDLLPSSAPVLVMVSGGADSVSLLHMLAEGLLGEVRLAALHVNHMLRGDSADEDEAFVRDLCGDLGVEFHAVRYDVGAYADAEGLNLEDAGRRVRYRFADDELDALCSRLGVSAECGRIAVAHTLDDRIETFFMRAIAGSGTGALGSIGFARGRIVRPLIDCGRVALRDWLRDAGRSWREDPTNSDTARTRALVRAELLPVAEKMNPAFRASLLRTMDLLADDDALLASMAEAFASDFADIRPGVEVAFSRQWMSSLEHTMARRTVRAALAKAFPEASRLEAEHIEALVRGLASPDFAHDLPGGLRAHGEYDRMVVSHADTDQPTVAPGLLFLPGTVDLGTAGAIRAEDAEFGDTTGSAESIVIDGDAVSGELAVDSVRSGDRMQPFGMEGSRKLSDLLVDGKVPRRKRAAVPVVRDGEHIVWLAGVRMSEQYRVTGDTTRPIRLTWMRGPAWK